MKSLSDVIAELTPEQRKAVGSRFKDLCAEVATAEAASYNLNTANCNLRAAVAELRLQAISDVGQLQTALEERDAARAEVAALSKDAERYRWFRSNVAGTPLRRHQLSTYLGFKYDRLEPSLDAAIDAALADKPLSGPTP